MIEFYPEIKLVHVGCAIASGAVFFARGLARQLGAAWPRFTSVRFVSHSIDTVLLTAALMLMTVLHQYPIARTWLTVKVALVVVYILLGAFAISYAQTARARWFCFIAALATYGAIVLVARYRFLIG